MATFFVTQSGKVINIDFVNAIIPIKLKDLYENKCSLSSIGKVIAKEFKESVINALGIKKTLIENKFIYDYSINDAICKPDDVVAYSVYLNANLGGMNNSNLTIYITVRDYQDIVDMFF